ncbi:MAG TPA: class I SAM-dependent methyltransferase [Polyangiaceae bacterium]|nr:class I SAM-dependent methyltransferase [Polyangiaceae bacterium]
MTPLLTKPLTTVRRAAGRGLALAIKQLTKREWERQTFGRNERPIEYRFVFEQVTHACPETVLDVGSGSTALPSLLRSCGMHVTAMDNVTDYWPGGMYNRHYHVLDDDIRAPRLSGSFDMVTCVSVLEHIVEYDRAVRGLFSLTNPGGRVVITCPYNEGGYVANAYDMPGASYGQNAPYVCQQYDRTNLDRWLEDNGAEIERQEYWRVFTGPHWTVGERLDVPQQVDSDELHQLTCLTLRKRG